MKKIIIYKIYTHANSHAHTHAKFPEALSTGHKEHALSVCIPSSQVGWHTVECMHANVNTCHRFSSYTFKSRLARMYACAYVYMHACIHVYIIKFEIGDFMCMKIVEGSIIEVVWVAVWDCMHARVHVCMHLTLLYMRTRELCA